MLNGAVLNIMSVYDRASDDDVAAGMAWYFTAHTFCEGLAAEYGVTVNQGAGIVAALSPRVEWGLNQRNADTLCRTGIVRGLGGSVRKAVRILGGEDPDVVLGGKKVRSFYSNISDPYNSEAVTIDRHAFDIILGGFGNDDTRKLLERKGNYEVCAAAYRIAAEHAGILPHQMQAITWEAWRSVKPHHRSNEWLALRGSV